MTFELKSITYLTLKTFNSILLKQQMQVRLDSIELASGTPVLITSNERSTNVYITIIYKKSVV